MKLTSNEISVHKVRKAIGAGTLDVGTLCTHGNVNRWSMQKPVLSTNPKPLTEDEFEKVNWGITIPTYTIAELATKLGETIDAETGSYDLANTKWVYNQPTTTHVSSGYFARLPDFAEYDHKAQQLFTTPSRATLNALPEKITIGIHQLTDETDGSLDPDRLQIFFDKTSETYATTITQSYLGVALYGYTSDGFSIASIQTTDNPIGDATSITLYTGRSGLASTVTVVGMAIILTSVKIQASGLTGTTNYDNTLVGWVENGVYLHSYQSFGLGTILWANVGESQGGFTVTTGSGMNSLDFEQFANLATANFKLQTNVNASTVNSRRFLFEHAAFDGGMGANMITALDGRDIFSWINPTSDVVERCFWRGEVGAYTFSLWMNYAPLDTTSADGYSIATRSVVLKVTQQIDLENVTEEIARVDLSYPILNDLLDTSSSVYTAELAGGILGIALINRLDSEGDVYGLSLQAIGLQDGNTLETQIAYVSGTGYELNETAAVYTVGFTTQDSVVTQPMEAYVEYSIENTAPSYWTV